MDCPICFDPMSKTCRSAIHLGCSHSMCLGCAKKWIVEKGRADCPMCRKHTDYFSRETRSKKSSVFLANAYLFIMQELRQDNGDVCLEELITVLDIIYFPMLHIWRRPDMEALIHPLKTTISDALRLRENNDKIFPPLRQALQQFVVTK